MAAAFQLHFMAFAVDVIDRRGPRNEMRSAINKNQKLVGCFLKVGYFIGYFTAVPLQMYEKYGRSNRFWSVKCSNWSENGQWLTVISSTECVTSNSQKRLR